MRGRLLAAVIVSAAVYANTCVYGFAYGLGDHHIELPWVNWLRDPALYPGDPITEMFTRFPTAFWPAVAFVARWISPQMTLLILFLVTKALFFGAVVRLAAAEVRHAGLVAAIALAIALSPFVNQATPFGSSVVLTAIEAHSALGVALMSWVGVFLIEGRWLAAAVVSGITAYVSAILVIFHLFAWSGFAVLDWTLRRRDVSRATVMLGVIVLSWGWLSRESLRVPFPDGYVATLQSFWPFHTSLRSHSVVDLSRGFGLIALTAGTVATARAAKCATDRRLELLAASFVVPVIVGALLGEIALTPQIARLQLLRADQFLVLYCFLLLELCGAKLLLRSQGPDEGAHWLLGTAAILSPLSAGGVTLAALGVALAGWWIGVRSVVVRRMTALTPPRGRIPLALTVVSLAGASLVIMRGVPMSRLWNPVVALGPVERDWRDVQRWAKGHTARAARFVVPTTSDGFRVFAERSSWGSWKDGQIMFHYPPFADVYRRRMEALGIADATRWDDFNALRQNYLGLTLERLRAIARENGLDYVVQFRTASYAERPLFANETFAVYSAAP